VFEQDQRKWCLIGGPNEKALATELVQEFGGQLINGVGVFDLKTSLRWIAQSAVVVGGDTGFTHVAATLKKPLLVIWGSTDPGLGFAPGRGNDHVYHLLANDLSCHPCSKLGFDACPKGHFRCMEGHSPQELKLLLQKLQGISL
jgi:ADP-heptose:LPS heptosyltransferase